MPTNDRSTVVTLVEFIRLSRVVAAALKLGCNAIIRQRVPLFALTLLTIWAPAILGISLLRPLLANILLHETYFQLAGFAASTTLALMFAEGLRRLVCTLISPGDPGPAGWTPLGIAICGALSVVSPVFALWYSLSQSTHTAATAFYGDIHVEAWAWPKGAFAILVGVFLGNAVLYVIGRIRNHFLRSNGGFFPFTKAGNFKSNYKLHLEIAFYLTVIAAIFFLVMRPNSDSIGFRFVSVATSFVWLVWFGCVFITGMSFWLDGYRIPTLLVLVLLIAFSRGVSKKESFQVVPANDAVSVVSAHWNEYLEAPDLDESTERIQKIGWRAIEARMNRLPADSRNKEVGQTLVIVTCPGGGIHAAAWTSYLLERLDQRYEDFADSVGVVSAVSGGSVGAVHFMANRYFGPNTKVPANGAWKNAAASSLEEIAAGLVFDDVPTAFVPGLPRFDRGRRLGRAIHNRLPANAREESLGSWGQQALEGKVPIVVLNATDAASGRRVLFDSLPTPPRASNSGSVGRPLNYRELVPQGKDVDVASAARCSATFPYVSPFARPDIATKKGEGVALGDGGYVDNEGIVTAVEWTDFLSRYMSENESSPPFRRILLLRIQPAVDVEPKPSNPQSTVSRVRWLTGPLEALANMRSASQHERGQIETDLVSLYLDHSWWSSDSEAPDTEPLSDEVLLARKQALQMITQRSRSAAVEAYETMTQDAGQPEAIDEDDREVHADSGIDFDLPKPMAMVGDSLADPIEAPVLVVTLPFIPSEVEPVPLNWKLSPKQKNWYPKAWDALALREGKFFQELDRLFRKRKENSNSSEDNEENNEI